MVNDEVLTVQTMQKAIPWEQYGIDQVYIAYDVAESKACIRKNHIDLILCDIEMPEENGLKLLEWVREEQRDIECIFLTCHASFDYAQQAIQLGCQDYVLMPARYEAIGNAVQKVIERIVARNKERAYVQYGRHVVEEKVEEAIENYGSKTNQQTSEKCITYIHQNLGNESLTVNELAEQFFVHPVHLNRLFKKEKGSSVGQYIINERMKMASEYLRTKQVKANVVAELVGYKSYANFNVMFKKYFGCSPKQYQKLE